jgi:hypothetical protein
MKNKGAERPAGICAFFATCAAVIWFVVIAVRRRSIASALLAAGAMMGGLFMGCTFFAELVAPDSDGVRVPRHQAEDARELFVGEEITAAMHRMDAEFGVD